jgi:hypothetical protein
VEEALKKRSGRPSPTIRFASARFGKRQISFSFISSHAKSYGNETTRECAAFTFLAVGSYLLVRRPSGPEPVDTITKVAVWLHLLDLGLFSDGMVKTRHRPNAT